MYFLCVNEQASQKSDQSWTAELSNLSGTPGCYEMYVTGRGSSFHIIFGNYQNGNYICIPGWKVGCDISDLSDTFWNHEQLLGIIGNVDAITISTALKEAARLIKDIY